jgi:dipeptidyl aminopeptidase/acylaminoacyl peptidase
LFKAVVAACGVMDVVSWYRYLLEKGADVSDSLSVAVYGKGPEDKPEAFRKRQAVRVAAQIAVPVLLQHGAKDSIVPAGQAVLMEQALRDAGHEAVTRIEYPNLGHAFWFWDREHHTELEFSEAEGAWSDFVEFLERHVADRD